MIKYKLEMLNFFDLLFFLRGLWGGGVIKKLFFILFRFVVL